MSLQVHWRNAKIEKVINADCQARQLNTLVEQKGQPCFAACDQPANQSSPCWINCFFETVLGDGHNSSMAPAGGISASDLTAAWLAGFQGDDQSQGGCPACPELGGCPYTPPVGEAEGRVASPIRRAPRAW